MKKIHKEKDSWGQKVIYVEKCDKYEYEEQGIHNTRNDRIYDIIYLMGDYENNWGK